MIGATLPSHPYSTIKEALAESVDMLYRSDQDKADEAREKLSALTYGIRLAGPERVMLIIRAGPKDPCQ